MEFVQPLDSMQKINQIYDHLRGRGKIRDLLLFSLGINGALRISDLLGLRVKNVFREDGSIRESFEIRDKKTNKRSLVSVPQKTQEVLSEYRKVYPMIVSNPDSYLFFTTHGESRGSKPMNRRTTWSMINRVCKRLGIEGRVGNHTLRKSWGYHARKKGVDLAIIQNKLNHSSLAVTKSYLGITDKEVSEVSMALNL